MRQLLTPYDYQQEIIEGDKNALFLEAGAGKTLIALNKMRKVFKLHEGVLPTLVFCPLIVLRNWKKEILLNTQLPENTITVVEGTTAAKRIKQISNPKNIVVIINYDALLTEGVRKALIAFKPNIVICDESHKIKNRTSKRFKYLMKIAKSSHYRYALTGTPMSNSLMDLFSQYLFLDNGETFGTSFTAFRNRYFTDLNKTWCATGDSRAFPNFVVNETMLPEITRKIQATSVRMKKSECLDLPEYVEQELFIPLSAEQRKHYEELKRDLITWLDDQVENPVVVKNALVRILRLNEISTGYMRLEDDTIHKFKKHPRLDALKELLENLAPHKVIIYAVYKENYIDIRNACKSLNVKYVELNGEVSAKDKLENVDTFNNLDNDVRVCISNPRSAGLGVNLKSAKYKIYYSRTYSLDDFEQSKARNYRAGSLDYHNKITDYHLLAPDTIDTAIFAKLKNKKQFAEKILDIKKSL